MSEFNITVEGGKSVKLLTGGKYCDRDIIVTAEGGGGSNEINTGTCTVKIVVPSSSNYSVGRETVSNGTIDYGITRSYTSSNITLTTRCDSVMYIHASTIKGASATDGEVLKIASGYGIAYKTPSTSGVTVTITLT